jgi:hypothetical protein
MAVILRWTLSVRFCKSLARLAKFDLNFLPILHYTLLSFLHQLDYIPPVLHIILGLTGNLVSYLYEFGRDHIEQFEPAVLAATQTVDVLKEQINQLQEIYSNIPHGGNTALRKARKQERSQLKQQLQTAQATLCERNKELTIAKNTKTQWVIHNHLDESWGVHPSGPWEFEIPERRANSRGL